MNYVDMNGVRWSEYIVKYYTPDGREFSTTITATSFYHAQTVVEDLRATAVLGGELIARIPTGE